jgi:uncharacterized repeat protein (TIGR03803 family)
VNVLRVILYALGIGAAALFAGCGGSQPPVAGPGALRAVRSVGSQSPHYAVLFSFNGRDGANPNGGLLYVNGTLYGTTSGKGNGIVFSITKSGTETVLHKFLGSPDGQFPNGGLIDVGGTLYGTTSSLGAKHGNGTIFSITTEGKLRVLHTFRGPDGADPSAGLLNVGGTLYGTTANGGKHGNGTVFSITTGGNERVLYSFGDKPGDGFIPVAPLIDVNGTLYGTTYFGGSGTGCASASQGCGTAFSVTTAGKERVLYSFGSSSHDGIYPGAALLNVNGTLYGTTYQGGTTSSGCASGFNCGGTVFSLTLNGKERILHDFSGNPDGSNPSSRLLNVSGLLYGTTAMGGKYAGVVSMPEPAGTVFTVTTNGKEQILHSFGQRNDGATPWGGLIEVSGTIYGTTDAGGRYDSGTVFTLKP